QRDHPAEGAHGRRLLRPVAGAAQALRREEGTEGDVTAMAMLETLTPPKEGQRIEVRDGRMVVPDTPIVPFIEGDGTGPDIWRATVRVLDGAVSKAYGGRRRIAWFEAFAGEQAHYRCGTWL